MIDQCGAMAMASIHYAYDQFRNFGHQPPHAFADIWEDYTALLRITQAIVSTSAFIWDTIVGLCLTN